MRLLASFVAILLLTSCELSSHDSTTGHCPATVRQICKDAAGQCQNFYISGVNSTQCKTHDAHVKKTACGSQHTYIYSNTKDCLALPAASTCPDSLDAITSNHLTQLASCKHLHKDTCRTVCGARFDGTDVRPFVQLPAGQHGLVCLDSSIEPFKKGESYEQRMQIPCTEVHGVANRRWCITYNHSINHTNLGAYLACAGRMQ